MKKTLFLILTLILIFPLRAENEIPRHGLGVHLGGSLSLFEWEYQYRFIVQDKHAFSVSAGINSIAINIGFPMGINYTYGGKNQLLLGLRFLPTVLLISFDEEVEVPTWTYFFPILRVGYGREMMIFKQAYTLYLYASPMFNLNDNSIIPWGGLGLTRYF